MSCAKGCCETQAEHYKSLRVASPAAISAGKTRVDRHDGHQITVHEAGDRQDVTVTFDAPAVAAGATFHQEP